MKDDIMQLITCEVGFDGARKPGLKPPRVIVEWACFCGCGGMGDEFRREPLAQRDDDVRFRIEVMVEGSVPDAGFRNDVIDCRGIDALGDQEVCRRRHEIVDSDLCGQDSARASLCGTRTCWY
jgi:hypothetical protein